MNITAWNYQTFENKIITRKSWATNMREFLKVKSIKLPQDGRCEIVGNFMKVYESGLVHISVNDEIKSIPVEDVDVLEEKDVLRILDEASRKIGRRFLK